MASLLFIGLLIGMRHALDADHVAAVATLVSRKQSLASTIIQGSLWGLGHTLTLLLFGSVVIFMDTVMPAQLVAGLELAVGLMLILLGADVLRRMIREKVHFHSHRHNDNHAHFHAHSHAGERGAHEASAHDHEHPRGFPLRALMVGLMHGMAGSAAVIILALETVTSPVQGVIYILVFGIGSMLGMALLSMVISIPLFLSAKKLTWAHNGFQSVAGIISITLGAFVLLQHGALLSV